jgi:heat shock protein HtpX
VRSAIINSGYTFPAKKITINLAPADLPKEGGRYDLPIAIALLAASEQLSSPRLSHYEFVGELAIYHAPDINAFATGARRDASLVAVSTGLLQNMSRDEAEAVIAHEISHIANGDMVTMTLIQGVVNTFVIFISRILAQIAAGFMGGNRDEGEGNNGNPLIYFAVSMVLELVFGILASIITMWFSRHREFHADAGSAKLVGREKMIAALQRLKTSYEPQEANSMMAFCINGKSKSLSELFMSHPPLDKRIEALRSGEYLK